MLQSTTIPTIFISNFLAFLLAFTVLVSNNWRWRRNEVENTMLIRMLALLSGVCVTEPVAFIIEGRPGIAVRALLYVCDSYTYGADLVVATLWLLFIMHHLKKGVTRRQGLIINLPAALGMALLLVNFFVPVVFAIDSANGYRRMPAYFGFMAAEFALFLSSFIVYLSVRLSGERLRFFNFSVYMLPVVLGVAIQTLFFGMSMIAPCIIVSLCGLMSTVQNEAIFKDQLTGLYNRYYLDQICKEIRRSRSPSRTFLMLDLNGFKAINDQHGHLAGDQALVQTAGILQKAVKSGGSVIRYAGDEFVVVGSRIDVEAIQRGFEAFNQTSGAPYRLEASIGCVQVDLSRTSVDEVMNQVDRLMYEEKRRAHRRQDAGER